MTMNNFTTLEIIAFKKADKVKVGGQLLTYFAAYKKVDPNNWYFYRPNVKEAKNPLFWVSHGWFLRVERIAITERLG